MIRGVFVALVVLVAAAFVTAVAPPAIVQPAWAADPAPCSWINQFGQTLIDLHEENGRWTIDSVQPSIDGQPMWAVTDDVGVTVWSGAPCVHMADVIRHEHMHLQQIRLYGSMEIAAEQLAIDGKERLEITADCASMLAGSQYTPYVALAGGCSNRDLLDAQQLLISR